MIRELDISPEYCPFPDQLKLACVGRNGYRRIWVGGSYSSEPVVGSYLTAISDGGLLTGVYGFVEWGNFARAKTILDNALRHAIARRIDFLLDLELGDPYSLDHNLVLTRTEWAINYCRSYGVEPICYTGPWWWGPATGWSTLTWGTMALIAEYVHDPDTPPAGGPAPVGGWSVQNGNIYGWQYAGTVETCGLNTDRIEVIKEADVAFDALKRATQDSAVRQLAGVALEDDMASLVAKLTFLGVVPPGTPTLKPHIITETGP